MKNKRKRYNLSKRRRGRNFEILVKMLEEHLGPSGIIVTSPDYIRGKSDDEVELDISLKGKVGTSDVLIDVECRERNLSQGVGWIRELIGRKRDIGADKIIAVSSSGFTKNAIKLATDEGIELRTLEKVDPDEIAPWFGMKKFPIYEARSNLNSIALSLSHPDPKSLKILQEFQTIFKNGELDANVQIFKIKSTGKRVSFNDIWRSCAHGDMYQNVPKDGKKVNNSFRISSSDNDCYQLITADIDVDIDFFDVNVDLWYENTNEFSLTAIRPYSKNNEILSQTASFDGKIHNQRVAIELHQNNKTGQQFITIRNILEEDDTH